jgi:hypothetical protein
VATRNLDSDLGYDTDSCKINTTNGRPVSLDGRIVISKPSSGSFIRWVLDGFTMLSATIATRR